MDPKELVPVIEFCDYHHIEYSFIHSLSENGLLEVAIIEESEYLDPDQVRELEKIMRLHYDLEINLQGIGAINHLLKQVEHLQDEVRLLKNRLRIYEE